VYEALCGVSPRPKRLARPWRNGALGGLTKPALGDAENYEGWEKRTHIGRDSLLSCSAARTAEASR
jgi:hypothetical protein